MRSDLIPSSSRRAPARNDTFSELQKAMSRLMTDFFPESDMTTTWPNELASFMPRLELEETESDIKLSAELPGMTEQDVQVEMDGDYLTIKGEKKVEKEKRNGGRYFCDRSFGAFERTVMLPAAVDKDKIKADLRDGVLSEVVPKTPEAKDRVKKIPVKH